MLVAIYLYYYRNPILAAHCESLQWCYKYKVDKEGFKDTRQANKLIEDANNDAIN